MGSTNQRPNFLVIVADDLGFSDLAPYGGEIETPHLAKLAEEGIRMTNFHTASACSPTRSMLFSGTDNHIAGLGQMAEVMHNFGDYFKNKPGYEGYLNWRVAALSEILQDSGYNTLMSGKWHLGLTKDLAPHSRGFDKNFSLLPGAGNHYNFEPQLEDGEGKAPGLTTEGFWMEGSEFVNRSDLPKNFYSTETFTDKMIGFLKGRTEEESQKPFFAYLPYTAPHWPLQAPRETIEKYAGMYDDGPDALTQKRLQRLKQLGLVDENVDHHPPVGTLGKSWDELSPEERKISSRKMEVFAAMVDQLDTNVGRVIEHLASTGELDNTFVLFMSDNGAEGAALEALPLMGGTKMMGDIIAKYYDNTLENIGEPNSFVWYGSRWACAATAPSRGFKCWVTEGGIRCPCIIRYPPFHANAGAITPSFTTVMDILPTILELAGVAHPGSQFRGREVVIPRGQSWVSHLASGDYKNNSVHEKDVHIHGWELFGHRAIREGKWKAVWLPKPHGKEAWELFEVESDPSELNDLAEAKPDVLTRLIEHWEQYYAETGMVQTPFFGGRKSK